MKLGLIILFYKIHISTHKLTTSPQYKFKHANSFNYVHISKVNLENRANICGAMQRRYHTLSHTVCPVNRSFANPRWGTNLGDKF